MRSTPPAVRPVTPAGLVELVTAAVLDAAARRPADAHLRVAVDAAPPAEPERLADALVDPLRTAGRAVVRASAGWFLRPASVRFERGRRDPDALREDWLDVAGLRRELLDPLGPGGSGRYLPTLHDPVRDRATRAAYLPALPGAVLLLDGALLLGRGLPLDLVVHLSLREPALRRLTLPEEQWTVEAHLAYAAEVAPEAVADVAVRVDRPGRPAVLVR